MMDLLMSGPSSSISDLTLCTNVGWVREISSKYWKKYIGMYVFT